MAVAYPQAEGGGKLRTLVAVACPRIKNRSHFEG